MRRNTTLFLIFIIMALLSTVTYKIRFSERARQAIRNEMNSKKIELGITRFELLEIMGEPNLIKYHPVEKDVIVYYYEPTFGSSDGIYFYLNPSAKVVYIKHAE